MRKTDILREAQDFMVLGQNGRDSYVYAAKPSLALMKQFYEQSVSDTNDSKVPVFSDRYWKFDEEKGITGSSTFLALRFDKRALRSNGLWLPGLLEAKTLEKHGKLENGVFRDYDISIYSNDSPNKEIAEFLIPQAEKLGLQLPLIVPFRAMDYITENGNVKPFLLGSSQGIIQGQEAQKQIDSLDYQGNSGVLRLLRGRDGDWDAFWDYLGISSGGGRVDWICGEATQKILKHAYSELSERNYGTKERELETELRKLKEKQKSKFTQFKKYLKG